jgi:hypothetical protein
MTHERRQHIWQRFLNPPPMVGQHRYPIPLLDQTQCVARRKSSLLRTSILLPLKLGVHKFKYDIAAIDIIQDVVIGYMGVKWAVTWQGCPVVRNHGLYNMQSDHELGKERHILYRILVLWGLHQCPTSPGLLGKTARAIKGHFNTYRDSSRKYICRPGFWRILPLNLLEFLSHIWTMVSNVIPSQQENVHFMTAMTSFGLLP